MMNVCRICLAESPDRDMYHLVSDLQCFDKTFPEIFAFCLDIEISEDTKTRHLCSQCYKKVMSFYKFKRLALKNDSYLRIVDINCDVKLEKFSVGEDVLKTASSENDWNGNEFNDNKIKEEIEDEVDTSAPCPSDDELLSVIKQIKSETPCDKSSDEIKDIEPLKEQTKVKKTRVRRRVKKVKEIKDGKEVIREICDECGQAVWDLRLHRVKHLPRDQRREYRCLLCPKVFITYNALKKHKRNYHLGLKKRCDVCGKEVVNLRTHKIMIHEKEKLRFSCSQCDKKFISPAALACHMFSHSKSREFACDLCSSAFPRRFCLERHKRTVHDHEKTHLCQYCSKTFFKKHHLQLHIRIHTKEKPYACPECGKTFTTTTNVKNHMTVHTGEQKYVCKYCDRTFARQANMLKHLKVHTREKNHPCKYCNIMFLRSDHRKRHEYTAHEKHMQIDQEPVPKSP